MNPKKMMRKVLPKQLIPLSEEAYRKGRLGAVHLRYGLPAKHLKVIAVTGTNGKTSTCNFLNDMLKELGNRTSMFTTALIEIDGHTSVNTTHRTVPLTNELFKFLKLSAERKVDWVILEVTSQSLHQHKLWGIPIEIAVMTNLTQDHLDYHKSMQKYAESKGRLFSKYMKPKWCVLNSDDEYYKFFEELSFGQVITYGKDKSSDLVISSVKPSTSGLTLRFEDGDTSIVAQAPIIGEFNAHNLAAATAVLAILGTPPDKIRKLLEKVQPIIGRMEIVNSPEGFTVVVDYAHTPDALEKALSALRSITIGKLMIVFGATGDRDKSKRPIMGEIASKLADKIFVTDEENLTEDAKAIRSMIIDGIVKARGWEKTTEIADRMEAIKTAIKQAKKGDTILVSGLGHQDSRTMDGKNIPWKEVEVVKRLIDESSRI